ncbi:MAG: NAD(P)-dependent alcohol dehydrogenase [Candidatus Nanopelagicales bacterium]
MTHPDPALEPTQTLPATMRAASRFAYGSAAQIEVAVVDRPEPGPGEVLVKVAAAGLDRATLHLLEGKPYVARLALGVRRPRRSILGQQVAGVVAAVGAGVSSFAVGDRVFGTAAGSFAEYAVAKASTLARTPAGISDAAAATFGVSGLTAHEAVHRGRVRSGQQVLVLGASGAVGTYAVQLAAVSGAHVTGVCSARETRLRAEPGCRARASTTGRPRCQTWVRPFDLIIDIAGNRRLRDLRLALSPAGALVIVGGEGGGPFLGGIHRNLIAGVTNPFTKQRLEWFVSTPTTRQVRRVRRSRGRAFHSNPGRPAGGPGGAAGRRRGDAARRPPRPRDRAALTLGQDHLGPAPRWSVMRSGTCPMG